MKSKLRKIILAVLVIVIGLPVAIILAAWVCFYVMDRTNGTIVSSGVTRRYLLYVPKADDRVSWNGRPSRPLPRRAIANRP